MRIHAKVILIVALALALLTIALGATHINADLLAQAEQDSGGKPVASASLASTGTYSVYLPIVTRQDAKFTFVVIADVREYSGPGQYDTPQYFRGACETIAALGIGSAVHYRGMDVFQGVCEELRDYMERHGYGGLEEFRGRAAVNGLTR